MIEKKTTIWRSRLIKGFFKVKKTTAKSSFLIILWINSIHKKLENLKNPSKKMKFSKRIILTPCLFPSNFYTLKNYYLFFLLFEVFDFVHCKPGTFKNYVMKYCIKNPHKSREWEILIVQRNKKWVNRSRIDSKQKNPTKTSVINRKLNEPNQ